MKEELEPLRVELTRVAKECEYMNGAPVAQQTPPDTRAKGGLCLRNGSQFGLGDLDRTVARWQATLSSEQVQISDYLAPLRDSQRRSE